MIRGTGFFERMDGTVGMEEEEVRAEHGKVVVVAVSEDGDTPSDHASGSQQEEIERLRRDLANREAEIEDLYSEIRCLKGKDDVQREEVSHVALLREITAQAVARSSAEQANAALKNDLKQKVAALRDAEAEMKAMRSQLRARDERLCELESSHDSALEALVRKTMMNWTRIDEFRLI